MLIDELGARLLVGGLSVLSPAMGVLPRVGVGQPVCAVVGGLWYASSPAARAAVRDNLQHITGLVPSNRQVREVFVHGALNYWDTLAIDQLTHQRLFALVDLHGRSHLDAALLGNKGAILAGAHLGSIGLVGQIVPALGYRMSGLIEPIKPQRLYDFFAQHRQRFGLRLYPASALALRELLAALRRNEVLGLITDRDVTDSGQMVRFFDAPTRFADGPAALALRTGAPILPAVAVRRADGTFDAIIEPPIDFAPSGDHKRDVLALTQAMAGRLEYHIANHPEQWTVFQRRWPMAAPV
ncbi:MAG TPA: lysophospholipid acyltransferase family protein [Chloroflexota bacterium]|nr:lysophospholipid acyltransferase family protein [Chloroflexota bacterium]